MTDKKQEPMHSAEKNERRKRPTLTEQQLYKMRDINSFIDHERRGDELDRLREVQEQKRTWRRTVLLCLAMNLVLVGLAVSGMMDK